MEADLLELRYVPLSTVRRWDRNPKKHDMQALSDAIRRYGFTDPPKYDPALNDGAGGLAHGNGRDECLAWMQSQGEPLPRGIGYDATKKDWLIPVLFGVDAPSQAVAEAYAIDHNNLTMAGGDFRATDMARMWNGDYSDVLQDLIAAGEMPVTLDLDDMAVLNGLSSPDVEFKEYDESVENDVKYCTCPSCGHKFPQ
jgi:hypothetical protein